MGSLVEFLTEVLRFFSDLFSRRRDEREDLWARIQDVRSRLVLALEEGRVADVPPLRAELSSLLKRYSKYVRRIGQAMRPMVLLAVAAMAQAFCGCLSGRQDAGPVFVLGERINLVSPGDSVEVPDLISPAKQWYLVDNVALQNWLGVNVGPDGSAEILGTGDER